MNSLEYATYLNGDDEDMGLGIDVDSTGAIVVAGSTKSENLDTPNALDDSYNGGFADIYLFKVDSTYEDVFTTYLGGNASYRARDLRVDSDDNIIVVGRSTSDGYSIVNASQANRAGGFDFVITSISSNDQTIQKSSYFRGEKEDIGEGVTISSDDDIVVTGKTPYLMTFHSLMMVFSQKMLAHLISSSHTMRLMNHMNLCFHLR